MVKRRISCSICFVLALSASLSAVPVVLHFWLCEFSSRCFTDVLWYLTIVSVQSRRLAIAIVFGPLVLLLLYAFAFFNCHRPRDVLERDDHPSF